MQIINTMMNINEIILVLQKRFGTHFDYLLTPDFIGRNLLKEICHLSLNLT